jgi:lysophospholipase L1-like esterase
MIGYFEQDNKIIVKIRILLTIGYIIFAFLSLIMLNWENNNKLNLIGLSLLIILFLVNIQRNIFVQYIGFMVVFFMFFQTVVGNIFLKSNLIIYPPNFQLMTRWIGNALPGITGTRKFTTDYKGFRTTKIIDYENASRYRVFAIGGSTTVQGDIDDQNTSSSILQSLMEQKLQTEVEVINAGHSGLRSIHHLATLNEIEKYHPSLVIIMMGANDWNIDIKINNCPLYRRLPLVMRCSLIGCNTNLRNSPLWHFIRYLFNIDFIRSTEPITVNDYGEYYTSQVNSLARPICVEYWPDKVSNEYRLYVKNIFDKCANGKYKCLVVSQITAYHRGASDEMKKLFWMTPPNENYTLSFEALVHIANLYNSFLEVEARKYKIPFCDAASGIPPTTEFFYDDMHLNDNGCRRLAELIFKCLHTIPE